MDSIPIQLTHADIVIVGGDSSLHYLLQRYAERSGYPIRVAESPISVELIRKSEPIAVIFPSMENLKEAQTLVAELTNYDIPLIVCSSIVDQEKTGELGADYCLLHPLAYDSFASILKTAVTSQPKHSATQGILPINPV